MAWHEMEIPNIYWLIFLFSAGISYFSARDFETASKKKNPEVWPYKWGYFVGFFGTICFGSFSTLQFIEAYQSNEDLYVSNIFLGLVFLIGSISHIFIIRRSKLGWVIGVIFQCNPVLWLANGIYAKNRWNELKGMPSSITRQRIRLLPFGYRVIVVGTLVWTMSSLAYFITFDRYGEILHGHDFWWKAKVILFPPTIVTVGYTLYFYFVKNDE